MEQVIKSLRESKSARWTAMVIVSLSMFGAYFFNYAMSPVKPMLESMLGWNSADFGLYTSSYGWFNVFLFMLIFSGIILDKFGIRITGIGATALMAIGTGINYWALLTTFPEGSMILGIKSQVMLSAFGFAIFGVGTEAAGITVSKAVVKWFKGKEMALAMGLQMSIARLGTALALGISLPLAKSFFVTTPVFAAFIFMIIGMIAFIIYTFIDKKLDASEAEERSQEAEDPFKFKDILFIINNRGFWYIAILCVLFYSAVFPFLFYATDLMINKYHVNPYFAGSIPSLLPIGTILLTPLFGSIYDKKGKGATIMILGSLILIFVHGFLTIPFINSWLFASALVIILGIGFSLVPAAMWPSVPKIIPEKQLGTAYAVIFWIQNIGLLGIPLLLGIVLNATNPDVTPNKQIIKDGIAIAFKQTLANDFNLNPEEISKYSEKLSSNVIDSIVQTTTYDPVPENQIDTAAIKQEIIKANVDMLATIDKSGDKDKVLKQAFQTSLNVTYEILKDKKLNIRYDYFMDMVIFTVLGLLSLIFAFLLKAEDKRKGYGLELPNIQK